MIRCIIIDKEEYDQKILISFLVKIPGVEILGVYNNPVEAMKVLTVEEVDLVFCAIEMPEINGISFLKSLSNPPLFVFVTHDPSFAIEGYELGVFDYIIKPIALGRLLKTITKASTFLNREKKANFERDFLVVKDRSHLVIMPYKEVFFIKSDKDYVWIETVEKKYCVWKRLIEMEKAFASAKKFIRVHKSYIVNLDFVKSVEGNLIKMKGNLGEIPIGGIYRDELFKKLGLIVKKK